MAWFWTDELARLLIEAGVPERSLSELLAHPAAIAATDRDAALDVARRMSSVDAEDTDAA
ncbi:MAG: hypothetical protein WD532_02610 [Acidimicrobiia bacterium]